MKPESLREHYTAKSDEELSSLAHALDSLTPDAQVALADELKCRGIDVVPIPANPDDSKTLAPQADTIESPSAQSPFVWFGLFLLNTAAVYVCAIHLSPMLVGRWFAWVLPFVGSPVSGRPGDWYLKHLEVTTILPAVIAGYFDLTRFFPAIVGKRISRRISDSPAAWAWVIPGGILTYGMLTYRASSSVLFPSSMSPFRYFFDIQQTMPDILRREFGSDPVRLLRQMTVTAPFYAGIAYSMGAVLWKLQSAQARLRMLRG